MVQFPIKIVAVAIITTRRLLEQAGGMGIVAIASKMSTSGLSAPMIAEEVGKGVADGLNDELLNVSRVQLLHNIM